MEELKLGVVEAQFADVIWEHEPLTSGELVKLCADKLMWKSRRHTLCSKSSVTAAYFKTTAGSSHRA